MLYPKQSQTRCVLDLNGIWDLAREHEKCGQEDGFEAEKKVAKHKDELRDAVEKVEHLVENG